VGDNKGFGSVKINTETEEALAFKILFPAKNNSSIFR